MNRQLRVLVISASPQAAVEAAVARLGVEATAVIAGTPKICDGAIVAELAQPLPWGKFKAEAGRASLARTHWLATFGDSAFDMAMMLEADHAVAVRPKPELRACFAQVAAANTIYQPMLIELLNS